MNQRHKTMIDGRLAPDANEEYRLYQTLLGCWPPGAFEPNEGFRQRIREHVRKATNEAKRNTDWLHPNERWLAAGDAFSDAILTAASGADFLASFTPKAHRLAHLGVANSLAQLVLKTTTPGVPDFYQGCEVWNLTLVDPDNRHVVDWAPHERIAARAVQQSWRELLRNWPDGAVKLRLTTELLRFRREHPAVFQQGDYVPIQPGGRYADRVIVFSRRCGQAAIVVVVPRLVAALGAPPLGLVWEDTWIGLPASRAAWRNVFTDVTYEAGAPLSLPDLLGELPVAVLFSDQARG